MPSAARPSPRSPSRDGFPERRDDRSGNGADANGTSATLMRGSRAVIVAVSLGLFVGCGRGAPPAGNAPDASTSGNTDGGTAALPDAGLSLVDPLAPLPPDADSGLTDVSHSLEAVLERGALTDACERYHAGEKDRRTQLLCGKWMFFYEGYGTAGVPSTLVDFLLKEFEPELGGGFSKLGMIEDPFSAKKLPLGFGAGKPSGLNKTYAYTCAGCHFARLPDGRYAVGAPNHAYDYGRHVLSLLVFPKLALQGSEEDHAPEAIADLRPLLDRVQGDTLLKIRFGAALLPLLGSASGAPPFPVEVERHHANWKPGTMDFVIAPLPVDDGVHTVSKIPALWSLPQEAEIEASGMRHAMLGWTGSTASVKRFLHLFVAFGGGDTAQWPEEKLAPLEAYLYSLRTPENPVPADEALVSRGLTLFNERGCLECHQAPRGAGKRPYAFDEIGTDPALGNWLSPGADDAPCCGAPMEASEVTRAIKSPRLTGLWAASRFLHNGSLDSLEALFCLDGPRAASQPEPYGNAGHAFTCDGLSAEEKRALIAYLRAR